MNYYRERGEIVVDHHNIRDVSSGDEDSAHEEKSTLSSSSDDIRDDSHDQPQIPLISSSSSSHSSSSSYSNSVDVMESDWLNNLDESGLHVPLRNGDELMDGIRQIVNEAHVEAPPLIGPINDLDNIPSFFALSFPTLFPFGRGDMTSQSIHPTIFYKDWTSHLMNFKDTRFQNDMTFSFSLWNYKVKQDSIKIGGVYLKNTVDIQHAPSVEEMVSLMEDDVGRKKISRSLSYFMKKIPSTPPFWFIRTMEMKAAVKYMGRLPNFFYSFRVFLLI